MAEVVSVLAILDGEEDIPALKAVTDYVREQVEPVDVPWLKEAIEAKYMSANVNSQ